MLYRIVAVDQTHLHIPVSSKGKYRVMQIWCGNALVWEFSLAIADAEPRDYYFLNVQSFKGCALTVMLPDSSGLSQNALDGIQTGGDATAANPLYRGLYHEALRPQFHFSSRRGWLNDPNGLVYADGRYHLYYQHNPLGALHGGMNISWGHAVSCDLIRWEERPDAILPWRRDWMIASGSALVDRENAAGYGENAIIASLTALGAINVENGEGMPSGGQYMAASLDWGDTYHLFSTQASVPTANGQGWRDPRIFKHDEHYVMAVYETEEERNCVSFYASNDLHKWTKTSSNRDLFECPDIFPLETSDGETKWVLYGADGMARIGDFDGYAFHETGNSHPLDYGDATYAGQTWNDHPQGKRVHISWVRGMGGTDGDMGYEGMPFSQCMSIPCELTLSRAGRGYQVLRNPVSETETLREAAPELVEADWSGVALRQQSEYLFTISDVAGILAINVGRHVIRFDPAGRTLAFENGHSCRLAGETLDFRLLVDATTLELFFADGIACTYAMKPEEMTLAIAGPAQVRCERWALRSIWPSARPG